jgi:23S rRNA (pseudouridine1915-N3)-methyltransferase
VKLLVAAVGRMRPGPLRELQGEYLKRLGPSVALTEVEERRKLPDLKRREAELLLAAVPSGLRLVALDERGTTLSSPDLAKRLAAWNEAAFVIGGADGLDDAVRERAAFRLAFGTATWPHLLCRVMLLEQLYRARSILAGHPYHRS